jgi:hypothetical protein
VGRLWLCPRWQIPTHAAAAPEQAVSAVPQRERGRLREVVVSPGKVTPAERVRSRGSLVASGSSLRSRAPVVAAGFRYRYELATAQVGDRDEHRKAIRIRWMVGRTTATATSSSPTTSSTRCSPRCRRARTATSTRRRLQRGRPLDRTRPGAGRCRYAGGFGACPAHRIREDPRSTALTDTEHPRRYEARTTPKSHRQQAPMPRRPGGKHGKRQRLIPGRCPPVNRRSTKCHSRTANRVVSSRRAVDGEDAAEPRSAHEPASPPV